MRPASYFIFITILIAPVLIAQQLAAPSTRVAAIDDPVRDGWSTEVISQAAGKQLKQLGALLTQPELVSPDAAATLVTADFHSKPLRPAQLETVFQDSTITVRRML